MKLAGYLTTAEAAERLGVTPGRVKHYLSEGRLPGAARLGGTGPWLIPEAAVARFRPNPSGVPLRQRKSRRKRNST